MIEVYKKLVEIAETESEAAQFFINVMAIICSIDEKGISIETYNDVICSLSGDILGFKQFSKIVEVFSKDKKSTAEHVKVLTSFDDPTKDELIKAVGCVLTYNVKEVENDVKEKFLNSMMAVRI